MLNRNATKAMGGPKVLDQINHGMFPRFGSGGPVSTRKFLKLGGVGHQCQKTLKEL